MKTCTSAVKLATRRNQSLDFNLHARLSETAAASLYDIACNMWGMCPTLYVRSIQKDFDKISSLQAARDTFELFDICKN